MITILLIIITIIALILLLALVMRKNHFVQREIILNAPKQKVFEYIKMLKNQETFNVHAAADADRKKEFKGTDGTVGFIYAWSGNKDAGEGVKEIKNIVEGKRVEMEIRFVKPMAATATIIMKTESLSEHETKVSWSNSGTLKYPINAMIPIMEKSVGKSMEVSLNKLKEIMER